MGSASPQVATKPSDSRDTCIGPQHETFLGFVERQDKVARDHVIQLLSKIPLTENRTYPPSIIGMRAESSFVGSF